MLIDWAYAGVGALGEELVPLVQATYLWHEVERGKFAELEKAVLSGYVEGLREAGWQGDPMLVRLGYAAASALRYSIGTIRFGFPYLLEMRAPLDSSEEDVRETLGRYRLLDGDALPLYLPPGAGSLRAEKSKIISRGWRMSRHSQKQAHGKIGK